MSGFKALCIAHDGFNLVVLTSHCPVVTDRGLICSVSWNCPSHPLISAAELGYTVKTMELETVEERESADDVT